MFGNEKPDSELHHSLLFLQFGGQLCCDCANGIVIWPVTYNNLFNCILLWLHLSTKSRGGVLILCLALNYECAKVSFVSTQLE